jgi:phage-related minor tail protein
MSADLYAHTNILIRANTGGTSKAWTFGDDGTITFPDSTIQNTAFTGSAIDQDARNTTNLVYSWANTVNVTAQAAFNKANAANVLAQVAYDRANIAITGADSANATAIGAFAKANTLGINVANSLIIVASAPANNKGVSGHTKGMVFLANDYFYYCTTAYDGTTNIWSRIASTDAW